MPARAVRVARERHHQVDRSGPYLALKLVPECGDNLRPGQARDTSPPGWAWRRTTRFPAAGCLRHERDAQAAARLRSSLAAATVGRTDTALRAFYRRLSARIGKAKAVTATARKITALFYNAVRLGLEYVDLVRPSTTPGTVSGWSKKCIGAPRHSALFFSQLRRRPAVVLPFLRNRSQVSTCRSWRASSSNRRSKPPLRSCPCRTPQPRPEKLGFPLGDLIGVNVKPLRQLGERLLPLHGGQSHLRLEGCCVVPARSLAHRLS